MREVYSIEFGKRMSIEEIREKFFDLDIGGTALELFNLVVELQKDTEDELENLNDFMDSLQEENEGLGEDYRILENEHEDLQDEYDNLENELDDLRNECERLEEEIGELQEQLFNI